MGSVGWLLVWFILNLEQHADCQPHPVSQGRSLALNPLGAKKLQGKFKCRIGRLGIGEQQSFAFHFVSVVCIGMTVRSGSGASMMYP